MTLILFVLSISTIMMGVPQVRAQAVVDVTYGSTPTVDGSISAGEYADANSLTFATSGGTCTVYFKHNGTSLYVAFDVPNVDFGSSVQIFVDTNYDQASLPQTDDYRFTIRLDGVLGENQGTGTGWTAWGPPVGWTGARQQFVSTWNAEFAIPYAKLGITAGVAKTIGISFWNAWTSTGDYRWPTGADWVTPSTWGAASSSDNWAPLEMYWKANYTDYAPSGVPDFDQRQAGWQDPFGQWTWCVPAAVANSLWWMDSRYENITPPPIINDIFPLVSPYGPWDDHDPNNVVPFIEHLAYLMDTEGIRTGLSHTGTNVYDMQAGIAQYLSWTGLNPKGDVNGDGVVDNLDSLILNAAYGTTPGMLGWNMAADIWPATVGWPVPGMADNIVDANDFVLLAGSLGQTGKFYEQTVQGPDFYYVEEKVERSEDVILLLGFWLPIDGWIRIDQSESELPLYPYESGHAVTVAGVNSTTLQIAVSDPIQDNAEPPPRGTNGPGRVLPPPPHPHLPAPPYPLHNNATYVSHDMYNVTWAPPGLPVPANFSLIDYSSPQYAPGLIAVVEWAVIVSPLKDVAVISVIPAENRVYPTWTIPLDINVTVLNNGAKPADFTVATYYDGTLIGTPQTVINLAAGAEMKLTFSWDLTLVPWGFYTIKANATLVGDITTDNNEFVDGTVKVKIPGDIDCDCKVDPFDYADFRIAFGSKGPPQVPVPDPNYNPQADFNRDGDVDPFDYTDFRINFGTSTGAYPPDP